MTVQDVITTFAVQRVNGVIIGKQACIPLDHIALRTSPGKVIPKTVGRAHFRIILAGAVVWFAAVPVLVKTILCGCPYRKNNTVFRPRRPGPVIL